MRRSPYLIAEELKETLCTYLETAYRISHPSIVEERARLLRQPGIISQQPFVETTPRFQSGAWLKDIKIPPIPAELAEFASIGLPVGKYPLYKHQEEAIRAAWDQNGRPQDLIVASGTGSGKTEIFYLTILADILREAVTWSPPKQKAVDMGSWSRGSGWLHRRRYETRPAAIRAIVLYPMNALVNDQLRRLRISLNSDQALNWQQQHLHNNLIYFGRYTGQTLLPGVPENSNKRNEWDAYVGQVERDWENLGEELREKGSMPRLNGSEMLNRWNMQAAPPDILLTNYSMLEYMLVRPIEASIFRATKKWLAASKDNILTLVLDEAHTYSGARGTEVAYLIRRLYERLGVGPDQVRCIATSASLGETQADLDRVREFAGGLFNHPASRFKIVQAKIVRPESTPATPILSELKVFADFQRNLEAATDEFEAIAQLLATLGKSSQDENPIQQLYSALQDHPRISALRDATARKATELATVADHLWGDLSTPFERQKATAGLLAAGALARADGELQSELPPLLPSRMHLMYRGLPGLWACLDPNCSKVEHPGQDRPCGKVYAEPRVWCDCGARVVELLSCRVCGLLIGGGIQEKDTDEHRIWPYEDDLEGGVGQYDQYTIFALEDPSPNSSGANDWALEYRYVLTTEVGSNEAPSYRPVWSPPVDTHDGEERGSGIAVQCPRCGLRPTAAGRKAIEPLRTTGAQSFATLVEHAFRLQPARLAKYANNSTDESNTSEVVDEENWWEAPTYRQAVQPPKDNPNQGRKALVFSDSRQNAARLAGDLVHSHYRDVFRQLLLTVLHESDNAISVSDLVDRVLDEAIRRGIDPTFGEVDGFWTRLEDDSSGTRNVAENYLDTFLRREIADRQVGVEALGLARWVMHALSDRTPPPLEPFTSEQTIALIYSTLRILAGENVLVPRTRQPTDWPLDLVELYYRRVIITARNQDPHTFVWDSKRNNRLTRYLNAVLTASNQKTITLSQLMDQLWNMYFCNKLAQPVSGTRPGFGIPITHFALAPMPNVVYICRSCRYISAETVNNVCLRCHQQCDQHSLENAIQQQNNYYRLLSSFSREQGFADPFPLRVLEHTAQISTTQASIRERRFQDQFLPDTAEKPENPVQHGVDILSVTTTMEMGIDIGDLTVVGLHNTPPTVASYQQRAGRAGRRSDGVAEVITLARHRSHDQYYYDRMAEIITGPVRIPVLHLNNPVIARRHVNALALQRFFSELQFGSAETTLFEAFGTVEALLDNNELRLNQLRKFIESGTTADSVRLSTRELLSGGALPVKMADTWLSELPDLVESKVRSVPVNQPLLDLLIERGVLPRYAFPVDVVALWLERPSRWNQGEEIQRDLSIALSEYSPTSEIIVDGFKYKSAGLYTPYTNEADYDPTGWYYECPTCHYVQFASREISQEQPGWSTCPLCNEPVGQNPNYVVMPAIEPQGFRTSWRRDDRVKYRGGGQERAGYASPAQLVAGDSSEQGELAFDDRIYRLRRTGDLYVVNRGPKEELHEPPGFYICPRCGGALKEPSERHFDPQTHRNCVGSRRTEKSVLLHHFNTDIVLFGVVLPAGYDANPSRPGGRAAWLSLGTALRQGASARLQIDPEELAMGIRPWRESVSQRLSAEIFLYDTLPNGAGYAAEVAQESEKIFREALEFVRHCPTSCDTACYRCLLDYGNQRYHPMLDRWLAADLAHYVLDGVVPELDPDRACQALKRLAPFAREMEFDIEQLGNGMPLARVRNPRVGRAVGIIPTQTLYPQDPRLLNEVQGRQLWPVRSTYFDLVRRPFWVWNELAAVLQGRSDGTAIL